MFLGGGFVVGREFVDVVCDAYCYGGSGNWAAMFVGSSL